MGFFDIFKTKSTAKVVAIKHYGDIPSAKNSNDADSLNRKFKRAEIERYNKDYSIIGYEIKRSKNCNSECSTCKHGAGKYPKTFNWNGWHDGCKCYITPVLISDRDFDRMQDAIMAGRDEKKIGESKFIKKIPAALSKYVSNNIKLLNTEKPDWFIDNKDFFDIQ